MRIYSVDIVSEFCYNKNMENIDTILIELKCSILDILARKKLEGRDEIPVTELLEELGMDEHTNITGMDPTDTIGLSGKALDNIEATKAQIRRGSTVLH